MEQIMSEKINLHRSHKPTETEKLETSHFIDTHNEQLYYVLHGTKKKPKARLLFIGPFASERPHRYIPVVRWARFCAANGIEVLRFDYRGCGESTGRFEDYAFFAWERDALECLHLLKSEDNDIPIILHGLGMGALIADRLFNENHGDILLLWQPAISGQDMLFKQLRLLLANNFVLKPSQRKTREQYVEDLQNGINIEVEGYVWTKKLWVESTEYTLSDFSQHSYNDHRPKTITALDKCSTHMFSGVGPNPFRRPGVGRQLRLINPDMSSTFREVLSWLIKNIASKDIENEKSHTDNCS